MSTGHQPHDDRDPIGEPAELAGVQKKLISGREELQEEAQAKLLDFLHGESPLPPHWIDALFDKVDLNSQSAEDVIGALYYITLEQPSSLYPRHVAKVVSLFHQVEFRRDHEQLTALKVDLMNAMQEIADSRSVHPVISALPLVAGYENSDDEDLREAATNLISKSGYSQYQRSWF